MSTRTVRKVNMYRKLAAVSCFIFFLPSIGNGAHIEESVPEKITRVRLGEVLELNLNESTVSILFGTTTIQGYYTPETEMTLGTGEAFDIRDLPIGQDVYIFSSNDSNDTHFHIEKIVTRNKSRLTRIIPTQQNKSIQNNIYWDIAENNGVTYIMLLAFSQYMDK